MAQYLRQVCNRQDVQSIEEHVRGDYGIWEYLQPFGGFLGVSQFSFLSIVREELGPPHRKEEDIKDTSALTPWTIELEQTSRTAQWGWARKQKQTHKATGNSCSWELAMATWRQCGGLPGLKALSFLSLQFDFIKQET